MRKTQIAVAFLLGLILGIGAMRLLSGFIQEEATQPPTAVVEAPVVESSALLARIREQEGEIVRLRAELAASHMEPQPLVPAEEPEPEPRTGQGFGRRMDERMTQRVGQLVSDYGLDDAQRQQLEAVFRKQFDNFRARRSGEETGPFNLDDEIAAILTPDQFSQYLEDSQQEIYNRAELIATTQLVRLGQSVELRDDQQEQVYDAVNLTAQEWMIARQTGEDFDMREVVQERLGTILTEEQLSAYRDSLRGGPGFGGGPPGMGP